MAIIRRTKADGSPSYRVVVHTPTQGHVSIGTFSRKKDAELAEADFKRTSKLEGAVFVPKKVGFTELSREWLDTRRVKPQTRKAYGTRRSHMVDYFGSRGVNAITRLDCESFLSKLNEGLAPRTANGVFKVFRQVMQYAVENGYIKLNPALGVKVNTVRNSKELRVIAPQDHLRLVEATAPHFRTLVYLLPLTGLRMGEVIGLRWSDVDLFGRSIHVRRQRLKSGGYSEVKSVNSERSVHLSKLTVAELRKWKALCPPSTDDLVFPSPWGEVMSYSYFYENVIYPLRKLGGFEALSTHDFRHTFVSWLIASGADIKYVQDQCGHGSASVTLDVYGHLFQRDSRTVSDKVGDWYVAATLPKKTKPQVTGS